MKPSIGRIVHYEAARGCFAAIITRVHESLEGEPETVDLTVFEPGAITYWKNVPFTDQAGGMARHWNWPPRV